MLIPSWRNEIRKNSITKASLFDISKDETDFN
jgi:hypothetical protein